MREAKKKCKIITNWEETKINAKINKEPGENKKMHNKSVNRG